MFHVYVLHCFRTDQFYIWYTTDVMRRLTEHNSNDTASTKGRSWNLLYYESYLAEIDAREREMRLKKYGKSLAMLKKRMVHSLRSSKGAG